MGMASRASARRRSRQVSPITLSRLADVALLAVFLVVVSGAVVRLTDSGLGCDNWPNCSETPFPQREFHATVEFVNRIVAMIGILLTLVVAAAARFVRPRAVRVSRAALIAAVGMVAQIPLGGLTVILDLHPLAVMSHFLLALVVLGVSVFVALEARRHARGAPAPVNEKTARGATIVAVALLPLAALLVVTGAFVTSAGPHPGGDGVERLGDFWTSLRVHVWMTGSFGLAFAGLLGLLCAARRELQPVLVLAAAVLVVLVTQMVVGELQRNNGLPWELVLAHVAMGSLIWAGMVAVAVELVRVTGWPERHWLRGPYTLKHP